MTGSQKDPVTAVVEPDIELDLNELCRVFDLSTEVLIEWVEEGVAEPRGGQSEQWQFSARQLRRVRTARRLQRDLGVDTPALPLVLDLLEELESLRCQVRTLERFLD
jgi:chaperone modulatory protein CbpM